MKKRLGVVILVTFFVTVWSTSYGQGPMYWNMLMQMNNNHYNQMMQNMQQGMQQQSVVPQPEFNFIYTPGSTPAPGVAPSYTPAPTPQSSNSPSSTTGNSEHSHHRCYFTHAGDVRHCGGDGRCTLCGGDGLVDGFGINNVQCTLCKGSGKCVTCHGTGWID